MADENIVIQTRQLCFSYDSLSRSVPVLSHINLDIYRGEWLAIIGHNGCGKSTFAKLLAGLLSPIENEMIYRLDRTPVQMVFQNPESQIVGDTVYEDICFGMENYRIASSEMPGRARAALKQCGLECSNSRLTSELSGGQKQLLAIAGCIAVDVPIIVFDEATSMLDPQARQQILKVLQNLHQQGKTIIWITQLLEELAYSERVIALEQGTVKYDGDTSAFFYHRPEPQTESPCEKLGFLPPFTVQVATSMLRKGVSLPHLPISPSQLGQMACALWR